MKVKIKRDPPPPPQHTLSHFRESQKEDQQHLLQETETTMKFGLFSMVQGYLHAMRLVQREKESWSGRGDAIGKDVDTHFRTPQTLERKKMVQVCFLYLLVFGFVFGCCLFSFVFALLFSLLVFRLLLISFLFPFSDPVSVPPFRIQFRVRFRFLLCFFGFGFHLVSRLPKFFRFRLLPVQG